MFTQPCFIRKNTPELRNKLENMGYTNGAWESPHFEYHYLETISNRKFGLFKGPGFYMTQNNIKYGDEIYLYKPPEGCIDCGTNEQLFLAIAALRNDTDKNQWFVYKSKSHWWFCTDFDTFKQDYESSNEDTELKVEDWHKATVEELIKFFN